jgi:obg-like ATPase 1
MSNLLSSSGEVDPVRDLEIISSELRLKDLAYLQGALDKVEKLAVRAGDKTKKLEHDTLLRVKELLADRFVRQHDWNEKEVEVLNKVGRTAMTDVPTPNWLGSISS